MTNKPMGNDKHDRDHKTIWAFMLSSVILYAGVAWFFSAEVKTGHGSGLVFTLLAAIATALFCTCLLLGAQLSLKSKLRSFKNAQLANGYLSQRSFTLMTMLETVSILGMVSRFMGYTFILGIPFYAASIGGLVVHRMQMKAAWRAIQNIHFDSA